MQEQLKEVFDRVEYLKSIRHNAASVCNKLNAEFHACFYSNKNDVWMSFMDNGKPAARKLGTFN